MKQEYWKITELKKLIELKKQEAEPEKICHDYLGFLELKVKLMEEARQDFGEKVVVLINAWYNKTIDEWGVDDEDLQGFGQFVTKLKQEIKEIK